VSQKKDEAGEIYGLACEVQAGSATELVLRSLVDGTEWRMPLSAPFSAVYPACFGKRCWVSLSLAPDDSTIAAAGGNTLVAIPMSEEELRDVERQAEILGMTAEQLVRERVTGKLPG
jgi:hypothetical protein